MSSSLGEGGVASGHATVAGDVDGVLEVAAQVDAIVVVAAEERLDLGEGGFPIDGAGGRRVGARGVEVALLEREAVEDRVPVGERGIARG